MGEKTYLGDGLYASFDGFQVALTAENGVEVLEEVFLDSSVIAAFLRFIESLKKAGRL
jgi:hypothetical protein